MRQRMTVIAPKEEKAKKKRHIGIWFFGVTVFCAVLLILLGMFTVVNHANLVKEELAQMTVAYEQEVEMYQTALKSAGWRIRELKKEIQKTNSFAMTCWEKRNVYKYIAEDWKAWGYDMEKLAQIHAKTFEGLRIENDRLTGENKMLRLRSWELDERIVELKKQITIKDGIVTNQKQEIERLSKVSDYWWTFVKEMKLTKKVKRWLGAEKIKD